MAYDRFVHWTDKKPTREEVECIIGDYFDDVLAEIDWKDGRFFLTLVGKHSPPLRRIAWVPETAKLPAEEGFEGRHMEVYLAETNLDVITREQDEFTNRAGDGLAGLFARVFKGRLEIG